MIIRKSIHIFVLFILFITPALCFGEAEVTLTGVASPQSDKEKNNIEKLRERAIRNAMDLAIIQVTGVTISSERGDSIRTREDTIIRGDDVKEQSHQQSRFRAGATSRMEGHARILEIIKEWRENGQYFVKAKIAVESKKETEKEKNCGDYWLQAGKPSVSISFVEELNGEKSRDQQAHTLRFLRDNLARNGVMISTRENAVSQYQIMVLQSLQSKELAELGAITMHCRLSYQIIDREQNESVAEYRAAHGPQAGFTVQQATESCIGAIAADVSENLVKSLGKIMIERWNNGVEQRVTITGMPDEVVTAASEILQNLHRITSTLPAAYIDQNYTRILRFKGSATDLSQAIKDAFADEDWKISITRIEDNQIHLNWIKTD